MCAHTHQRGRHSTDYVYTDGSPTTTDLKQYSNCTKHYCLFLMTVAFRLLRPCCWYRPPEQSSIYSKYFYFSLLNAFFPHEQPLSNAKFLRHNRIHSMDKVERAIIQNSTHLAPINKQAIINYFITLTQVLLQRCQWYSFLQRSYKVFHFSVRQWVLRCAFNFFYLKDPVSVFR